MGKSITFLALAGLLCGFLLLAPAALEAADKSTMDSTEITNLLADAKAEAFELKADAEHMEIFNRSDVTWESHASMIDRVREHVNTVGRLVNRLNEVREAGSPWQVEAIDQVTPLMKQLAANTQATVELLARNKDRLHNQEYKEFLSTNFDLSSELANLVADFVDYGKTKAKFEGLTNKLEVERR